MSRRVWWYRLLLITSICLLIIGIAPLFTHRAPERTRVESPLVINYTLTQAAGHMENLRQALQVLEDDFVQYWWQHVNN